MSEWKPDIRDDEDDPLRAAVFQALGAASMCWEQTPTSVFDSTKAKWVGNGLMAWLQQWLGAQEQRTLEQDIAAVLNKHSAEGVSDTPDFILAGALVAVLNTVDWAILQRGTWYGHHCSVGECSHE